jgi:squalene-hopene/tetraprenyl-beta-curcumene cyclase
MVVVQKTKTERPAKEALDRTIRRSQDYFRGSQSPEGNWCGELESNSTMEAEYLMLCYLLDRVDEDRVRKVANHILSKQRADGSWGQYYEAPGDLSTSVECYFALKLAGYGAESEPMQLARQFILSRGGVPKVRIFTKIWLALFGQWDWKGTPNMPPEMIFLPSWAPFNIYEFASWARATVVPMLIILTRQPFCPVPESANIDELYPGGREGTDYSLPKPTGGLGWSKALYWADKLIGLYQRLPIQPLRGRAERKIMRWVLEHQEADGSWAGIQPPWVYSLIALHIMGYGPEHEAVKKGFQGFEGFAIEDDDTCTVQACLSPVWDTGIAQLALLESGVAPDDSMVQSSARWLMDKQIFTGGDWQVRGKEVRPGGWSFEFDNLIYPDIDDASIVVMALDLVRLPDAEEPRRADSIQRGLEWMAGMQSKNGGWAAFDKDNNKKYLTKIPFSDFGETLDPPSVDVTAHLLEMYGRLGSTRGDRTVNRGFNYVVSDQEEDGSWFGRWGVNYVYGAGAVLPALEAIGEDMSQPYIRRSVDWIMDHQNKDGGWGESCGSYVDPALRGVGPSTASQTAWALLGLVAAGEQKGEAARRGVMYLAQSQQGGGTWDEPYFTGTGFPGYGVGERLKALPERGESSYQGLDMPAGFMINYHLYRNYWPLLALGRYSRAVSGQA